MSQEKRLSLSFGDFACDIVGYDDPFTILNRVMELFTEVSKTTSWVAGDGEKAKKVTRSRFAERIAKTASSYDLHIDEMDGRFVVSKRDTDEIVAEAEAAPVVAEEAVATDQTDTKAGDTNTEASDRSIDEREAEITMSESEAATKTTQPEEIVAELPKDVVSEQQASTSAETPDQTGTSAETPEKVSLTAEPEPEKEDVSAEAPDTPETEPQVAPTATEVRKVLRRSLRLNANAITGKPGPDAEESSASETAEKAAKEPEATVTPAPRRPRIIVDTVRSQPYSKPASTDEKAETPMPGLRFSITQQPTSTENANHASGLKAKITSAAGPDTSAPAQMEDLSDKTPLVLSEPMQVAEPAEEAPLLLNNRVLKSVDPHVSEALDDEENLFIFDDLETAPAPTVKAVEATVLLAEPKLVATEVPSEAPKKSGFGFGMFRRKRQAAAEETTSAQTSEKSGPDDSAFERLREAATAALPDLEASPKARKTGTPKLFSVSGGETHEDASSPAAFARQVGASSLQDLLEASAAYMAIVEGKAKFSRREVMHALTSIGPEKDYSPEARLKSFRRLITLGAIVPSDDGMFTISHATRFGYENQLRA